MNDIEHGWVKTVDRDYAQHIGAESWIDKKDIGDGDISDFIYEKDLSVEVAQTMTGAYECTELVAELLEILRCTGYKRAIEKAEYKIAEEHYKAFDEWMDNRQKGANEP